MKSAHDLREAGMDRFDDRVVRVITAPRQPIDHIEITPILNVGIQSDKKFGIIGYA